MRFPGLHATWSSTSPTNCEWERDQGPTDLDNLAGAVQHHHHLVHSDGWTLSGDANVEITFIGPTGG